jgi:hypothetical protein
MKLPALAALAAAAFAVAPAAAGPVAEGNFARADGRWGAELGIGYGFGTAGFTIRPMVGALVYRSGSDRYREVAAAGGTDCRDTRSGALVRDWRCENLGARAYGRVEATYAIPLFGEVGVGGRYSGDRIRPYGTAAFSVLPKVRLKANGGPDYAAAGLSLRF